MLAESVLLGDADGASGMHLARDGASRVSRRLSREAPAVADRYRRGASPASASRWRRRTAAIRRGGSPSGLERIPETQRQIAAYPHVKWASA